MGQGTGVSIQWKNVHISWRCTHKISMHKGQENTFASKFLQLFNFKGNLELLLVWQTLLKHMFYNLLRYKKYPGVVPKLRNGLGGGKGYAFLWHFVIIIWTGRLSVYMLRDGKKLNQEFLKIYKHFLVFW